MLLFRRWSRDNDHAKSDNRSVCVCVAVAVRAITWILGGRMLRNSPRQAKFRLKESPLRSRLKDGQYL